MAKNLIVGSIKLTDLKNLMKQEHSAFTKSKNGDWYMNILVWENEQPDQYGNQFSIQLNSSKEKRDSEKKVYIGNMKYLNQNTSAPQNNSAPVNNTPNADDDDLPF